MKAKIIKIGNSRGLLLPKQIIDLYKLEDGVEVIPEKNGILIMPVRKQPRAGWNQQFKKALCTDEHHEGEIS
jgi:antitoxin MazE